MDIVEACRAFVAVSGHGSFTIGAAAARIPQPVASRRVAALEEHFGAKLFDRTSRSVTLTAFGHDMLPAARRLVELAEAMEQDAGRAKLRPFRLAVPAVCSPRHLARLVADGRLADLHLDPQPAGPRERRDLSRSLEVRAALVAVAPDEATWRVPLGLAGTTETESSSIFLESLRASRADRVARPRRIWLQPEDDVPHVRDRMIRLRDAVGLQLAQVTAAPSFVAAAGQVLGSTDLLLCSSSQAHDLGLHWRTIGETQLDRGYGVAAGQRPDAVRLRTSLNGPIARCLGASAAPASAKRRSSEDAERMA
ncbi:LysR family transcriptional regulator [Hamadaea sp. NPDC051192]|uniref:LysR family transcriptional regulator n=1 Tax=Hamadaea sp. NPDC051192 TaxID=3154940 RepID=UPI0034451F88